MSLLPSLRSRSRAAVIGATGGLGRAFVELLEADDRTAVVHALSRAGEGRRDGKVRNGHIDLSDESSIEQAAESAAAEEPLDLVLVATGILHREPDIQPEKTMRALDAGAMQELFLLNAIGPALVAKHFLPRLGRKNKNVFAAISARVGSIGDNRLGGWASYRASKAALNMLLRTLSIEQARSNKSSIVVALHPGTVDTALSRPFQSRVPEGKLFTPEYSAGKLLEVIDKVGPADTGGFFAWDGSRIEY